MQKSKFTNLMIEDRPSLLPAIGNIQTLNSNPPSRKNSDSRLYEQHIDSDDSPTHVPSTKVSMVKLITSKINRIVPGKSIDFEQQMISDFVRKSKEMDF
jgi:hypothetical protein